MITRSTVTGLYFLFCLMLFYETAFAQQVLSGKVSDESGAPMPGVNLVVKGTTTGTTTGSDGQYSLQLPPDARVVIFSFIGYTTEEVTINNRTQIDVTLQPDPELLSEVVVLGYTTAKKENITGSVASVDVKKLRDFTSPNIGNLLQGKVAGAYVLPSNGRPGSLPVIRIRGRSTISSSNEPIWVVDGVIQHGVPNINPQDIQTLSILKDASAAALYGARGANGVIVVTTKMPGSKDGKSITVSVKSGVSRFNTGNFSVMNSAELHDYYSMFGNPASIPDWYTEDLKNTNTDWVDIATQTGVNQEYDISFRGGSDKMQTFAGGNYYKEEGTVKGYSFERFSGRMNLDVEVSDRVTFKPKLSATYTKTSNREHSQYDMYRYLPWDKAYNETGKPVNAKSPDVVWLGRDMNNYLYDLQWNYSNSQIFNILTNFDFEVRISETLTFNSTNGITYYHSDGMGYTDPLSNGGLSTNGAISGSMAKRITRFSNQMLMFNKKIDKHSLQALAAFEFNDYVYNDLSGTGKGIVSGTSVLNSTSEPQALNGSKNAYAFQSFFVNANYSYDDRYNFQASVRRDGASRFGKSNKYGNFFSASAGWNIDKEAFMPESKVLDALRLKIAYGGVGNVPTSLYPQYELYELKQYNGQPAAAPATIGNDNISWEKLYSTNIALEVGLLDRIDLSVEAYDKNTSGLLHYVPLPTVSGFSGYWDNVGSVNNRGIEFTLGADVIRYRGFTWHLDANIATNRNRITELYQGRRQISGLRIIEEGNDIDTWFMRKWVGVNPDDGKPMWEAIDPSTGAVSNVSVYSSATTQKVGTSTPKYFGGFNSSMDFKGFYLQASFVFLKGAMVYNSARETFDNDGAYPTYNSMKLRPGWSRWSADNPNATHPQPIFGGSNNAHRTSSRFLEDASYLRMRSITLGYNIKSEWVSKLHFTGANIYVSGENLFTRTKYSGIDPEVAVYGDNTSPYPTPKRLMVGLNVSF
jgi:TonB-linked SusC/RagA family outer membrane protein